MGVVIPQVVTEDRASGAQVIDGGLVFNSAKSAYLERTPSGVGNLKTWTWSAWVKRSKQGVRQNIFGAGSNATSTHHVYINFMATNKIEIESYSSGASQWKLSTNELFRDIGWYHFVWALDTTQSTSSDRIKFYINGSQVTDFASASYPAEDYNTGGVNAVAPHTIGKYSADFGPHQFEGSMTQVYLIDGQQLDASYFGFTDPLTNTWRPKKYSGTFGTNGFWLPMDGNSPIGLDESGNGNDWTPVNLSGSVGLDKATGALPIFNTNGGGSVANAGVRTDAYASNLVLALPLVGGVTNDLSNSINSTTTAKTITKNGDPSMDSASSNFYGNSLDFDASGDYLSSSSSSDFAFGTDDFTIEYWANYDDVSTASQKGDFQTSDASGGLKTTYTTGILASFGSSDGLYRVNINSSNVLTASGYTTGVWYHNAITREGSTLRLFRNGILQATASNSTNFSSSTYLAVGGYYNTSYLINGRMQDFRVYKGVAKYTSNFLVGSAFPDILPDTPSGVATKTSLTKITEGSVSFDGTGDYLSLSYSSDFVLDGDFTIEYFVYYIAGSVMVDFTRSGSYANAYQIYNETPTFYGYSSSGNAFMTSDTALSRGWNHLAVTRTISNNTARMFINGVQTATSTSFSHTYGNDTSNVLSVGAQSLSGPTGYFTGHISNLRIIKGTALYTSNFTPPTEPLTNVTNTKLLCCHDPLSAVGSIVTPGNITANGDAVATTFNPFNTNVNTIRGQETTYATLNLNDQNGSSTVSNGSLDMGNSQGSSAWGTVRATIGASSGKFYAEYTCTASSGGFRQTVGVVSLEVPNGTSVGSNVALNNLSDSAAYFNNGQKSLNGSTSSYGAAWTAGDVVGIALDVDETSVTFFVNGVSQGVASSALASDASLTFGGGMISSNETGTWNFGQKPFKFTPPDGFKALTGSSIRPEKVSPDGSKFIAAVPYAGNSATNKITTGFAPDFVWIKNRTNAYAHCLFDTVRGAGKRLESDANYGEDDYNLLNTFNDNGFTLGVQGGGGAFVQNTTGTNSMSWSWKAGGNKNTFNIDDVGYASAATAGLDGGSTNPTGASVNTKSKFGIYTFDGNSSNRTMSHGLGQQPDFMICKKKSTSGNSWVVWHKSIAATEYILLNSTAGKATDATLFNSHASDSSTLWTIGSNTTFNETGQSSVAYLWCDVPGLQKFGKFTGNGNAAGPYIELGFRPSILIIKDLAGNDWYIYDDERSNSKPLFPNGTYSEQPDDRPIDFLSNGFKIRYNQFFNGGSANMIYAAWAEAPSFNMFGAASNARATK